MEIGALTAPELIFPDLPGDDGRDLLAAFAGAVAASRRVRTTAAELLDRLLEREALGVTAIGGGVALPHCKLPQLARPVVAIGMPRSPSGIAMGAADGVPVRLLFMVLSPADAPAAHLQAMAAIARWARDPARVRDLLAQPREPGSIHGFLCRNGAAA